MTLQPPDSLAYSRSGKIIGTARNGPTVAVPGVPPPYRAERHRNPGTQQPSWLAQKIENSRRAARPDTCRKCGANVLVGPDHDTCAMTARVDLAPVDAVTEVAALLTGRYSCSLINGDLCRRFPEHVHARRRPYPVHVQHSCREVAR